MTLRDHLASFTTRRQKSISSASLVLAITFGLSAILGLLRSNLLYGQFFKYYGADLDAYNAAFRLPDLIFKLLVTGALSASFIPVFSSYLHRDKESAYRLARTVINLLLAVFIIAAIFVLVFTRQLSSVIAPGFTDNPQQFDLMINLTRILLVAQIFFLISNFFTSILQVHQVFVIPALSPIIYNLFIILSIITLAPSMGIYGVTYGAVVGAFFHLAIQIPIVKRVGFIYSPQLNIHLPGVKEVIRLMLPRTLSLGLGEIENTVTLFFSSTQPVGHLSLLNLAIQLMYLPSRIFSTTVGQAALPILSKNVAKNQLKTFRKTVEKIILQSLYLALPVTIIILIHRLAIVRIAFGSKNFPWTATLLTARTLAFLTPAIVCQGIIQILVRSFYALHNTKTPLKISFISLIVNVVSATYFINYTDLGIVGLAISASLGNLTQCFGLVALFARVVPDFSWSETIAKSGKILIASAISGIFAWSSLRIIDQFVLDTSRTVNLLVLFSISVLISVISYLVSSKLLKIPEYLTYEKYLLRLKKLF